MTNVGEGDDDGVYDAYGASGLKVFLFIFYLKLLSHL